MSENLFPTNLDHQQIFVEDTDAPLPKSVVNSDMRYTDYKMLAKGGKCVIQTCKDNYLGRTICHKSLRKEFIDNRAEQRRFLREARVTAMMQHPNTIPVYEINRNNQNQYFFTMKLVEGLTLEQVLEKMNSGDEDLNEEFKIDRMLGMIIQIGNALAYAHSHGVVHRDIKPANIVIGPFGEVWVLDWGLAKVWHKDGESSDDDPFAKTQIETETDKDYSLTGHGKIEATPLYMSPEQITNSADVDFRTDIYNFGALFYEILTLETLAYGETLGELFERTKHEVPIAPSKKAPKRFIPKELDRICLKCIEKDPSDRYQDIVDVVHDIRNFREIKYTT